MMMDRLGQRELKRDFAYSILCLLSNLFIFLIASPSFEGIVESQLIPNKTIVIICLLEFGKVFSLSLFFPLPYVTEFNGSCGWKSSSGHSKKDHLAGEPSFRRGKLYTRVKELLSGIVNLGGGILICHFLCICFGAPVFQKWEATLGFSSVIVLWLYFPLTLAIHPASVLQELAYISFWKYDNLSLTAAKTRFLAVTFGAWIGAIVIPLDWDRPWQKWPIPNLVSAFLANILVNAFFLGFYSWKIIFSKKQGVRFKKPIL